MNFINRYLNKHIFFEIAPVLVFFLVSNTWGMKAAIIAIMVATVLFTFIGFYLEQKIPVFPIVTLVLVLSLGGAALVFDNPEFIKIKPTIGLCLFGIIILAGLRLRPSLLARALEGQVYLSEKGWQVLTIRWVAFSLFLAIANEFVWRTQSTGTWVSFKTILSIFSVIGFIIITRLTAPKYWLEPEQNPQQKHREGRH